MRKKLLATRYYAAFYFFLLFFLLVACSPVGITEFTSTPTEYPKAEVVIEAHLSEPLPEGISLYLEIIDDVTGLYFNASRHAMAALDETHYYIRIPVMVSSELKYRYVRIGENTQFESNSMDQQVRFRIARVDGPNIIHDEIASWFNEPFLGVTGKISGQVFDKLTNSPIPNLLIVTGGLQSITASDGTFLFEQISPGLHNLVVYSLDGGYETFQQDALVAEKAVTPVHVALEKRQLTSVTFTVRIPDDYEYDTNLPLRIISNLHTLGNSYADLAGGAAGNAANYPVMEKTDEKVFRLKLSLPVGMHLRYKYSFGDGFWNAELNTDGAFKVRELIVTKNNDAYDQVLTFLAPEQKPVRIEADVPLTTPKNESVSIQLNPFGWMEPLPMQNAGDRWFIELYSPLHLLNEIEYRFCRNGICPTTPQNASSVGKFLADSEPQTFKTKIESWDDLNDPTPYTVMTYSPDLAPRPDFMTGIELTPFIPVSWLQTIDSSTSAIKDLGADWVIFSTTWTMSSDSPLIIEPLAGRDLLWDQQILLNSHLTSSGIQTILYPKINYTQSSIKDLESHKEDLDWQKDWFAKYSRFVLQSADLAATQGIPYLMIGDPAVTIAGIFQKDWIELLSGIRARYSGQIIGVAGIFSDGEVIPEWLDMVDMIYVLVAPDLTGENDFSTESLVDVFGRTLELKVKPIHQKLVKPILIGFVANSSKTALRGISLGEYIQKNQVQHFLDEQPDEMIQAMLYNAAVVAASKQPWVTGFFATGYSPFLAVSDASSSTYAKPASDALWFWYHFLLNK